MTNPELEAGGDPLGIVGQVLLGRYRVLREVGRGAQAAVYEAEQLRLGRRVAIKLLVLGSRADRAQALTRFQREARILARLSHPSIAAVFDVDTFTDDKPLMVMEWLSGESVRAYLQRGNAMPFRQAFRLIAQAADALAAAHAIDVVHRDIKPDNLFLCEDGSLKVLDFGIALERGGDGAAPRLTGIHQILGTPSYMSPEQMRNARDLDGRSDLYSLGCVLYNLVSGRRVWPRGDFADIARALFHARPVDIQVHVPALPDPAARVVRRAMEPDRAQRFQTMAQLRAALFAAAATEEGAPSVEMSQLRTVPYRPTVEGTTAVDGAAPSQGTEVPTVITADTLARVEVPTRKRRRPATPPYPKLLLILSITFALIGLFCAFLVAERIGP
jgi:serine/threonine-protein kinase